MKANSICSSQQKVNVALGRRTWPCLRIFEEIFPKIIVALLFGKIDGLVQYFSEANLDPNDSHSLDERLRDVL